MEQLRIIYKQAKLKGACDSQLNKFKHFIDEGDILQAWQTVLGNVKWLKERRIDVPSDLEILALYQGKTWHENGMLWIHEFYQNGKLHGERKVWNDKGALRVHEFWKDNKLHGERKEWNEDGVLRVHDFLKT